MSLIFMDVEAPFGVGSPAVGDLTEFGAVEYGSFLQGSPLYLISFHGKDSTRETFERFDRWIKVVSSSGRPIFVSDNPAYDWQWINFYFWKYLGRNPFGHSARRIGDFYAGLCGDFWKSNEWKHLRLTPHDHNPVHDALGNAEAFQRMLKGER